MTKFEWNPAELLKLSGSYWATCALHAAVKLDLFTPLQKQSFTADSLAAELAVEPRALAMLLDAMSALGLLHKEGERYAGSEFSNLYLASDSEKYLGHIIMHHHHLVRGWSELAGAVKSGQPYREPVSHGDDPVERESFLMGMFNLAMLTAPKVVSQVNLQGRYSLLDLGGGPGTYAIHFCQNNPQLAATVVDLPTSQPFAEKTIRRFGLEDLIPFVPGDFNKEPLPREFDAAWLSHVLHGEGEDECRAMLAKVVDAMAPGGLLLVQEFVLNDAKDGPPFPTLFSLNMLLNTTEGRAYSEAEIVEMMSGAGLRAIKRLQLDLPNGAGVLQGEKP
ncbi:MAG: SAM-dependent methyltransferase [Desulfuromonas sp.]|nr:MAG: SAM-dependent methyltransferase [Desulfuromonas sp.]